jgi:hypothetical protein
MKLDEIRKKYVGLSWRDTCEKIKSDYQKANHSLGLKSLEHMVEAYENIPLLLEYVEKKESEIPQEVRKDLLAEERLSEMSALFMYFKDQPSIKHNEKLMGLINTVLR